MGLEAVQGGAGAGSPSAHFLFPVALHAHQNDFGFVPQQTVSRALCDLTFRAHAGWIPTWVDHTQNPLRKDLKKVGQQVTEQKDLVLMDFP